MHGIEYDMNLGDFFCFFNSFLRFDSFDIHVNDVLVVFAL